MPVAEWAAYVAALAPLEAADQLARIEAAAFPWQSRPEQRRTLRRLARAGGGAPADADEPPDDIEGMAVRRAPAVEAAGGNT